MSNKEEILEQSLNDYKNQLSFVISALNENKSEDLIELKDKLEEIIALTEVDLISVKKSRLLSELNSGKYNTNNEDIEEEPKPSTSGSSTSSESSTSVSSDFLTLNELINGTNKSLIECLNELNGKECRAPFAQQNGSVDYHNAVIMISDTFDDSINDSSDLNVNDIKVKVFFTYPLNNAMLSCPHYMDGKCKYGDRKCKYSHGYYVSFANIKPFIELNYSTLTRDSLCLAKCQTDRLWYKAIIDDINDDNKVVVKYSDYDVIDTIGIEDIIPFSDDNPEECENKFINTIVDNDIEKEDQFIAWDCSSSAMAEWEVHTKGIGSKLMAKMGYVWGQGLGRNGEGITQPIEAFVFPTGKSLDTCMQLREKNALKDPLKVRIKLKAKKLAMESKIADRYNVVKHKESIFDFINTKVFAPKVETQIDPKNSKSLTLSTSQLKTSNTQSLNISSLKICEDLRKAESELKRLKAAIDRNKSKDKKIVLHLEEKVNKQNLLIKSLRDRESLILKEQKMRSNKQKLTIF